MSEKGGGRLGMRGAPRGYLGATPPLASSPVPPPPHPPPILQLLPTPQHRRATAPARCTRAGLAMVIHRRAHLHCVSRRCAGALDGSCAPHLTPESASRSMHTMAQMSPRRGRRPIRRVARSLRLLRCRGPEGLEGVEPNGGSLAAPGEAGDQVYQKSVRSERTVPSTNLSPICTPPSSLMGRTKLETNSDRRVLHGRASWPSLRAALPSATQIRPQVRPLGKGRLARTR